MKIIIVDDHPLLRDGIKKIIEKQKDMKVCGESGDANEALKLIVKNKPDIAIIDISLEGNINGIELIKAIKIRFPEMKTMVISMHDEADIIEQAIKAGATGFLSKKEASSIIIKAIKDISSGMLYLSNDLSKKIVEKHLFINNSQNSTHKISMLTKREKEIFELIGHGLSSAEIGKKLNLSVNTIESHKKNIKDKLALQSNRELTKKAISSVINKK